ncbi:uncharacterized protein N7483_013093 [Penicillium malachiteum]|uniref:uncharacterized protein n=1 Tax=Penicillium malachiteum TaxID=1324776 RepID=UPI0025475F6F|nr:uncharacterized protein N7483_013093 [Penicillium malachiteum]KAJ5715912.1 hypothetical protein N7483_013093 [Penicillium malachiteum]
MSSTNPTFPRPGVKHGKRILTSVIEQRANSKDDVWVSVPMDETNLSLGFKDITVWHFNNAANHAAHWLNQNLSASSSKSCALPMPVLRIFVIPSWLLRQPRWYFLRHWSLQRPSQRFLRRKVALFISDLRKWLSRWLEYYKISASHIQTITVPPLEQFLNETEATSVNYSKTWEEEQDDPWLVFHTSGTTGNPKPITYSHYMMAMGDRAASLPDIEQSHIHQLAEKRWYTPLPSLHLVGMPLMLSATTLAHMRAVIGPTGPPTPETVAQVIKYGHVEGALLPPVLIDALCLTSDGLEALKGLTYIHYAGAPLSAKSGELLAPHVQLVPSVGSTECGGYFTVIHGKPDTWDYLSFQKHTGAKFELRANKLYELVFVRDPSCKMQQIFKVYPILNRFETNDLWLEHPTEKRLWKIIGGADDYVCFSHGEGIHASFLEPEITAHPNVKNASWKTQNGSRETLLEGLQPYIEKFNARCHQSVQVSLDKVIIFSKQKPFLMTSKASVARLQTLRLYEDEIAALFP